MYTHFDMNLVRPIIDLYKRQVFELAVAQPGYEIVTKRPSAELAPDQFDEDNLLPYAVLDPMVQGYVEFISDFDAFKGWVQSAGETISIDVGELNEWLSSATAID